MSEIDDGGIAMSVDCIVRQFNGCTCKPGECLEADRRYTPPPNVSFTWRDHAAVVATGLIVMAVVFAAMSVANERYRQMDLIAQENIHHG